MRWVLLSFLIGSAFPALAANELAECADIESAVERLDCYDRLAREPAGPEPAAPEAGPPDGADTAGAESAPPPEPTASRPVPPRRTAEADRVDETDDRAGGEDGEAAFGLGRKQEGAADTEHIRARIESIRKAPLGQHVMTLSNGQVWMENEPGRRPIAAGQEVTIRKQRWHYEMELRGRPNVAVRRVE